MGVDELIDFVEGENCQTYAEFLELQERAFAAYDALSAEEQEMVDESMCMEGLSMVMMAFDKMSVEERRNWRRQEIPSIFGV